MTQNEGDSKTFKTIEIDSQYFSWSITLSALLASYDYKLSGGEVAGVLREICARSH